MSGFFEGSGSTAGRGFFQSAAPAPTEEGIGGAINVPGLDDILASEGAQRVKPVLQAILAQESGGNPNVRNSVDGAQGIGQVMPATFKRFAKQGERIDNPADNLRVAARFMNFLHDRAGGDPAKMAAGYFSGEGNIGTDRPFKTDHADGNGKRVSSYVNDVLGRLGSAPAAAPTAPAVKAPKWSELTARPSWGKMTPAERELGRAEYFNRYIAPHVDEDERAAAKLEFIEKSQALDPKDPTLMDKVVDGIKSAAGALKGMPDPLRDSMDKRSVMERMGDQMPAPVPAAPKAAAPAPVGLFADLKSHDVLPTVTARAQETRDMLDPSAEARTRRLISQGMNVDQAKHVGATAAEAGVPIGEEGGVSRMEKSDFDFATRKKYNEDPFFKMEYVRGAVKGYEGYKQGIRGLNQFAAEALGADDLASDIAAKSKQSRGFTEAMGTPTNNIARNFEGAVSSIATQLPALIGGAVTGSEALALGSMFAQTFGSEYSDGRAQGQTQGEATQRAGLFAAFEVIGERLGLGEQLKLMRDAARGMGTNVLAKFMANTLTKELPGEMVTTTGQFLTDKLSDIGLNKEAGLEQYLQQMGDTVTQTFMQGAMMSTGGAAINKGIQKWNTPAAPKPQAAPRVEPTMDAHAAGLTPEQQVVDQQARDAFADLIEPTLQDDEIPASTLLGAEATPDATTEASTDAGLPPISATPEATNPVVAATEKKTKLTPFSHPDLDDVEIRGELAYMADQAGWEQVGGKMIRADGLDQSSDVTGRTPWIPKQPWYQMMPERLNEDDTIEAVGKALTGQPMTAKEKRVIANMLDFAKAGVAEQKKWHVDAMDAVGATSTAEYEQIGTHADALESMDADIPFDLNDPRQTAGKEITDEELDGIFGKQSGRVSEKPVAGNADENAQGTGAPRDAGPEAFQLEAETPEQVKAKERATEKTKAAERKAKADQDAKEKAEREKKDIRARGDAAADNFQLGEDPEAALSGQKGIFEDAPAAPKERFGDRNNASVKDINDKIDRETASWGFKPGTFDKKTHSNGAMIPFFEKRDDVELPTVNNKRGDAIRLGQGPNGKWAFGLDIYGAVYGPGLKGIHDHVIPDGRTQYNTREEAIDAALQKVKEHGKPGAYEALKKKAKGTDFDSMFDEVAAEQKPKTEKQAKAKKAKATPAKVKATPEAIAKVQEIVGHFAKGEKSFIGDVPNPGFKPSGVTNDDWAHSRANDAAFRAALEQTGWTRADKKLSDGKPLESWTRDGATIDLNHPIVGRSASIYARPKQKADFDAMFDEVAAEEKPKADAPKAEKPVHELTRFEYRADEESRGKTGGLKAASINPDNETVESLLKNHRSSIPFLGMLMGAKGGKNVPKMAADIMRIWKLRGKLSKATADSLVAENDAAGMKALAKEVGIYSAGSKASLAARIIDWRNAQRRLATERLQDAKHYKAVSRALAQGEAVRADVVKDYPELAVQYFGRETPEYKAGIKAIALTVRTSDVGLAGPIHVKAYRKEAAETTGKESEVASDIADEIEAGIARSNQPVERSIGEAAVSAAKNTGKGMANAALGLAKLFDPKGTVGSGPVFNEHTYAQAKPLFIEAVSDLENAAVDLKEVMRKLFKMVSDMIGYDKTLEMKPYMVRFMEEYEEGNHNEPATGTDSQQDGPDDGNETSGRDYPIHGGPAGAGPTDSEHGGKAGGQQDAGTADGIGVHDSGAPAGGAGRRDGVSEPNGELGVDRSHSESDDATGSGGTGTSGTTATDGEADGDVSTADEARDVEVEQTFAEKVDAQKKAEKIAVVLGDKANIDATLPLLLPAQREDVLFAEKRLAKPTGYGVLFANGTGTGKTYLSLGIIKRMIRTGKKNGVVIVPNQEVMNEWLASAPNLGIDLYQLGDKQDKGQGVSITTYANYGDNMKLLDREHDFVVADEAHNLMASKDADVTLSLEMTRAITKHPESAYTRTKILHNPLYVKMQALRAQEQKLLDERADGKAGPGSAALLTKIGEELRPLYKEWDKALEAQKDIVRNVKPEERARLVAVSATPFAWEKNVQWGEGFLFNYDAMQRTGAYNEPSPYQKYMMTNFGWHMKNGKLNEPDAKVNRSLMQIQYNTNLRKQGVLSTRMLKVDKDYDRRFVLVDGGIGARIDAALQWLRKGKDGRYSRYHDYANKKFDFLTKSRLLEAIKAKAAVDIIKQHHALGRKVVVFHDFNEGGGFEPFTFPGREDQEINVQTGYGPSAQKFTYTHGEFLADFAREFPDLVGGDLGALKSPIETLREAFPNALFNNGLEKKKNALQSIKDFNNDDLPGANLLVVQSAKNAGWSGHDRSGKFQRVSINLGLPTAPVKSIQLEGRIYRTGQMSDAIFRYLNTGTLFERFAFATAIATRSETAENLAMGVDARGLKRSFIDAFNDSGEFEASHEDGRGGKEQDRATNDMTPFKRAITYYYANQKKNSKTKAAEGVDYFPTPEPLGLKMVEWLEPKTGRDYLEPSAGHGAIARWFPDDVNVKAIEPSAKLASDLSLNMFDPTSVINDTFEGHYIGNKYDGIAMNPPFGTGGKTAMEHVAKAFGHLKEGGRLIAIVPAGPSMDKRVEQWLTGTVTSTRGGTSLGNPDAVFTAMLQLPPSTFGRAGTSVSTRIIVIDKVKGGNTGRFDPKEQVFLTNAAWEGDVNSMFAAIENLQMPPRPQVSAAPAAVEGVTQHAHGRVVEDAADAVFKKVGDKLETDAPIVKVKTAAGKELEGVIVPDRALAKSVDNFTYKPPGQSGFLVRIRHVIRPTTPSVFARSDAEAAANGAENGAVSREVADRIIGRVVNALGGRLPGISFKVVDTFDGLPAHIRGDADTQEVRNPRGVYHEGVVYLILAGNKSAKQFEETVFHELHGHAGLDKLYGNGITKALDDVFWAIGGHEALMKLADKHGMAYIDYAKGLAKDDRLDDQERRRYMVEELLGHIAEEGPGLKHRIKALLGALRGWLRSKGFPRMAALNDNDLAYIVSQARRATTANVTPTKTGQRQAAVFRREESARSVNLRPAVKAKVGLLDTPMRLAMQKTGALAVWRGAFRLLEKTASRALSTKMGEIVKAGLIDRYGLSDAVIERHEEMRVKMIAGVRTTERFLDRLQGLSRAEYAVLYAAANNADIEAVNDMIAELPEDSQKALHEIKELVRDLGQDAVDLKMLDVDTFKANELAYLHRSYLKHEADLTEMEKSNRATRIKGDQFKQRGLADIVSSDRLMKWMPEFWGTRVKNGAVTSGTVGQVFIRLERRDDPRETPSLEGIEGNKALGRLKEVVYWPQGEEIPAKFGDWHVEGEWTVRRTEGKSVVFRRDFTQEERRTMGEIEDIRYAMAKTINIATHDVEVGKYFAWLAEGHARLPGELPRDAEVIDDPYKAESRLQTFTKDVWVRVPDVKIKGTGVSAYGKLAGRYIPGPIWTDIRHVANGAFYSSKFGQNYEKLLRLWKLSKTALSPAVHVNNVMANVVMADWHDIGGKHLLQAAAMWARQGKSADAKKMVEDFQDNGGELGTFALNEMQREQLAPILEELLKGAREANDLNGIVNAASVMSLLREGMVRQAAATLGQSRAGRVATSIPRKMIDVYQLEDQIFRLAAFIKGRESGLTAREAGRFARKSFLDYDIQAPWVVAAKRSGLLPFVSFSYRAIPMLYETVRDKPWKLMKLALVLGGVSAASAAFLGLSGDDDDDERRWLPDEKSGKLWGMIPKLVRMPWNTGSDNPVFLDVRRFIPAGDIVDTGTSQGAIPLPPFLTVGGPLSLMVELYSDKSLFTGKELNKASDSTAESAVKVLDHIYKWAAPNIPIPSLGTIVPGTETGQFQTYAWTGIVKAAQREEGAFGRDQNVPMAIGSAFGIKLEGYSPATGVVNAKGKLGQVRKELRMDRAALAKQRANGGLSDADYVRRVKKNQEKEVDAVKGFAKRATE